MKKIRKTFQNSIQLPNVRQNTHKNSFIDNVLEK